MRFVGGWERCLSLPGNAELQLGIREATKKSSLSMRCLRSLWIKLSRSKDKIRVIRAISDQKRKEF